ncbi:transcription factor [Ganoderma sinense ZZ0214-1]|uniref:RNA-directed DNA polymerase n=1 Tax=Ganoderma sinense ZZ0214-1 TaxID=1077348 RepID=A0A2G8SDH3_9APHY|nr:transcription factor [Ganoderma sinense ZZ0214-1]
MQTDQDLLGQLAASLPLEAYNALAPILQNLDQRVEAAAQAPAPAPPPPPPTALTVDALRTHPHYVLIHILLPSEHHQSGAPAFLREGERRQADWPLQVPLLFRGDAMSWYSSFLKKVSSLGKKVSWGDLKSELYSKFDSPLRVESLRSDARNVPYKGNLLRYIATFREIESQIPESDMTFGDRFAYFLAHLPAEYQRDLRRENPKNVEQMYFAARELHRLNTLYHTNPAGMSQPKKKGKFKPAHQLFPSFASSAGHAPTTSTTASTEPQPMDLDAMENASPKGPAQQQNMLRVRCFNCNRTGHYSRNCRAPRKPRQQALNAMEVDDEDDSTADSLFVIQEPESPNDTDDDDMPSLASDSEDDTDDDDMPSLASDSEDDTVFWEDSDSDILPLTPLPSDDEDDTCSTAANWGADTPLDERDAQVDGVSPFWQQLASPSADEAHAMEVDPPEAERPLYINVNMSDTSLLVLNLDDGADTNQDVPVYHVLIPTPNRFRSQFRCVSTIVDSGAASCYIIPTVVRDLQIETIPITRRTIRGAGITSTSAIARFRIKIGGIVRPIVAYVLDRDCLRYGLVLGQDWMRRHNAQPDWKTRSWYLTDPHTEQTTRLAMESPHRLIQDQPPPYVMPPPYTSSPELYSATSTEPLDCLPMDTPRPRRVPVREQLAQAVGTLGDKLRNLVKKRFPKLFGTKVRYDDIPTRRVMHTINTQGAQPVRAQGRPHSPPEHEEIKKFVDDALEDGLIEPSTSPWSAPIIFAKKKDGTNRLCVDYRRLNDVTVKNAYPLPRIDDTYQHFHGAKFFTTLDLKSGYWQIPVHPESREKTAFTTRFGHYQFRVMEFGLCNAPATFQSFMNELLRPFLDCCVIVYLDDIVIFSNDEHNHVLDVLNVLGALNEAGIVLNEKKCVFARSSILYLGHIISNEGIRPDPDKVNAIISWPTPDNITRVRGFLNLAGYYRRFIPAFARLASPLYDLLKGSPRKGAPIQWSASCEHAFETLKHKLTSSPVLGYPRPWHLFVIDTDASGDAIGGILHQSADRFDGGEEEGEARYRFKESKLHPIAYESRRMSPTEQRYSAQEREMLAIDYCLQKWRGYVEGSPVVVRTDHESLKYFLSQKHLGRRLARFADNIAHFDVRIIYRPGRNQLAADALSRRPGNPDVPDSETLGPLFAHPLEPEPVPIAHFETLEKWRQQLLDDPSSEPSRRGYALQDTHLWRKVSNESGDIMVRVPTSLEDARKLIHAVHDQIGHLGARAVLDALRVRAQVPRATDLVTDVVRRCDQCQFTRREAPVPQHLHPLPRVDAFDCWAFDWIGPLQKSVNGNQYILTALDHGSDLPHATAHAARSHTGALELLRALITQYGKPKALLTDNGEEFLSYPFQNYLHRLGIEHLRTSPYHPQTNGRLEKFNDNLTQTLAWLRARTNTSTGASPAFLAYGREARLPSEPTFDVLRRPPTDDEVATLQHARLERVRDLSRFRGEANMQALRRLEAAAEKREDTYRDRGIGIGSLVLRRSPEATKLHPRWDGPFIVHDLTDRNTYQLRTKNGYVLRTLYNAERLKPYNSSEAAPGLWYSSAELQRRDAKSRTENDLQARRII